MTPHLGQGGNQAIEDALVLAHHAEPGTPRLAAYSAERLPRTMAVLRRSRRVGRLGTLDPVSGCALRDVAVAAVSRLGPRLALRALDGIADCNSPQRTYAAGAGGSAT